MYVSCNVVLLPSTDLANKAIVASGALSKYHSLFTLHDGVLYPHLSLYMVRLDDEYIERVSQLLGDVAENTHRITAVAKGYSIGKGYGAGYIDAEYQVSPELRAVQELILRAVNPLRSGMRENDIAKLQDARGVKLANLEKYGYSAIGELFRPHITFTRLPIYNPAALEVLPDVSEFSGVYESLGLFELGDHGTCTRKIATFPLG